MSLADRHCRQDIEWIGRQFKLFRLAGTIGNCRPKPYGNVGSLESSLIVKYKVQGMRSWKLMASLPYDAPIARLSLRYPASCSVADWVR